MPAKVSVCIPVFNRKQLVMEALQSVLTQDISDLEIIVVDNHSDDGTWEVLQTVQDPRLRLCRNDTNIGLFGNFNRAGQEAKGDFVLFLCSDDVLRPDFLAHALAQMQANPDAALLSSAGRLKDENGRTVRFINQFIPAGLYDGSTVRQAFFWLIGSYSINIFNYPSGILLRRSVLEKALPFRKDIGDPADVDLWLRCLEHGDFLVTDFVGCDVTWHEAQLSSIGRKAGKHITEIAGLAALHLAGSQDRQALQRFNHMLGASVFAWTMRAARNGDIASALGARRFGHGWFTMMLAAMQRSIYVLSARVGIVFHPHLRRASAKRS